MVWQIGFAFDNSASSEFAATPRELSQIFWSISGRRISAYYVGLIAGEDGLAVCVAGGGGSMGGEPFQSEEF